MFHVKVRLRNNREIIGYDYKNKFDVLDSIVIPYLYEDSFFIDGERVKSSEIPKIQIINGFPIKMFLNKSKKNNPDGDKSLIFFDSKNEDVTSKFLTEGRKKANGEPLTFLGKVSSILVDVCTEVIEENKIKKLEEERLREEEQEKEKQRKEELKRRIEEKRKKIEEEYWDICYSKASKKVIKETMVGSGVLILSLVLIKLYDLQVPQEIVVGILASLIGVLYIAFTGKNFKWVDIINERKQRKARKLYNKGIKDYMKSKENN